MIPISDELKSAVLHEVTPKNVHIKQSNTLFSKSVEMLNWFDGDNRAGWSMYDMSAPSFSTNRSFWSSTNLCNVINTHFGDVKYVYFVFDVEPQTPTNETLTLNIKTEFLFNGNTFSRCAFEETFEFVNDGRHRFGHRIDGDIANNIKWEWNSDLTISDIVTGYTAFIGHSQIFLSDRELDFDDIPENYEFYATEENVKKIIPTYPIVSPYKLDLDDINFYNKFYINRDFDDNIQLSAGADRKLYFPYLAPSSEQVNYNYVTRKKYLLFTFDLKVTSITKAKKFGFRMSYKTTTNTPTNYYIKDVQPLTVTDYLNYRQVQFIYNTHQNGELLYLYEFWIRNVSEGDLDIGISIRNAQVRLVDELPQGALDLSLVLAYDSNLSKYLGNTSIDIDNSNIISESLIYKESICSSETLKFGLCEASEIEIDVFDKQYDYVGKPLQLSLQIADVEDKFEWDNFIIAEAKKTYAGDIQKRHIIAYDNLKNLNENAYAWYSQYMWGINLERAYTEYPYMFDYCRQIFSTYYNLAKSFGIEKEQYITEKNLGYYSHAGSVYNNRRLKYDTNNFLEYCYIYIAKSVFEDNDAFMVVPELDANRKTLAEYSNFLNKYDSLGRGIESANVLIEFIIDGQAETVNYLCDSGDIIIPPENWTGVNICTPNHFFVSGAAGTVGSGFTVFGVKFNYLNALDLVNGTQVLPYFSYVWRKPTTENIFKADSSITARDVMRSLMEMCGCFFRLNREGHPQFLYAMEHGLYPSNTLFPADDLFPRKSSELTMPTSYYIRANFEEYRVSNFGGVQVVVNTYDSQGAVVRWEYWGDETSDNAYLIDDNIFLCNSQFEYEPEMAGNVQELLENLWNVLNNMSYTPFTAETIGTPFLESGDRFTLLTKTDGFESFIFERTLKGIQVLKDYYEARGVAKTPRVKNFEWGNTNE